MKTSFSLLILLTVITFSCKKEDTVKTTNLLINSSFETDSHDSTFVGWTSTCFLPGPVDNPMAPLLMDAPGGGGSWCLQLVPLWLPAEGYAEQIITGQSGDNIYKAGTWIKTFNWAGAIALQQWRNGQKISEKSIFENTATWTYLSFYDTLNVLPTDTLRFHLTAGTTEVSSGWTRFDGVSLVKL